MIGFHAGSRIETDSLLMFPVSVKDLYGREVPD